MKISARVYNRQGINEVLLKTNENVHSISIPPKVTEPGSSANGGELLFLALATCYCNDIYREAANRGIQVATVEVTVEGEFGAPGEPARSITYSARVSACGPDNDIREMMKYTDTMAEIQNTLRSGIPVTLRTIEVTTC